MFWKTFDFFFVCTLGITVAFYFSAQEATTEQTQHRQIEASRLTVVIPLTLIASSKNLPSQNFRCWRRIIRSDGWIGLQPVVIRQIQINSPLPSSQVDSDLGVTGDGVRTSLEPVGITGMATLVPLTLGFGALDGTVENMPNIVAPLDQLFCDASTLSIGSPTIFNDSTWKNVGGWAILSFSSCISYAMLCYAMLDRQ